MCELQTDVVGEIAKTGVKNVALVLNVTEKELRHKMEHPELFSLRDLNILIMEFDFTKEMILLTAKKIKSRL